MRQVLLFIFGTIFLFHSNTSNAQITWQKKNGPYGGQIQAMETAINGDLYVVTSNYEVYKSANNGASWQFMNIVLTSNERIFDVEVGDDGTVYAVGDFNFYSSIDNGATWIKQNSGTNAATFSFDQAYKVEFNPVTGHILMIGYHNGLATSGVYLSLNGGVTWSFSPVSTDQFDDLVINNVGQVFGYRRSGGSPGVFVSTNETTFTQRTTGLSNLSIFSMTTTSDGGDVFCITYDGIFQWDFFGDNWIDITENLAPFSSNQATLCTATDGSDNYLFIGDNQNQSLYVKNLSSTNNWSNPSTDLVSGGHFVTALRAKTPTQLFAATYDVGVYTSTNGGFSWTETNTGIEGLGFSDMVYSEAGSRLIAAADQHLYSSTNNGSNWTRFDLTGNGNFNAIRKFIKLSSGRIFGYGTVNKVTSDNGVNWTDVADPFPSGEVVAGALTSDETRFFAYNFNNEFVYSGDQGLNWTSVLPITGMPAGSININNVVADANHNLYASIYVNSANANRLYKITFSPSPGSGTPTGGTATLINTLIPGYTITNLTNVALKNGNLYAMGQNSSFNPRLCISTDGAASFTSKNLNDGGYNFFVAPNGDLLLITSNNDQQSVHISRDDGTSFQPTSVSNSSNGYIRNVVVNQNSGIAFVSLNANYNHGTIYGTTGTIIIPSAPANLTLVGRGARGLTLRFDDTSIYEEGFVVQREINGVFTSIDSMGSLSLTGGRRYFRDRILTPGTTYNYRVGAYSEAGASSFVTISVATLPLPTPSATPIPDNRSWTGVTANVNGLASPGTNTIIGIKHTGNGRYTITDVSAGVLSSITGDGTVPAVFYEAAGQTYFEPDTENDYDVLEQQNGTWNGTNEVTLFWRLDKDGSGGPYPDKFEKITLTLNASDPIPAAPTNIHAYIYSNTSIEVSWKGDFYETSFTVQRSTSSLGPFTNAGTVNYPATRFEDTGLTPGQTYFYRVIASNATGSSAPSAVTTTGLTLTNPMFVLSNSVVSTNSPGSGTGFIWGDYDNDGDEDLILTQLTFFDGIATTPYSFRNDGGGNFTAVNAGFELSKYFNGITADYDNDGKLDVFFNTTATENLLYKGNGDFTFTKVTPNPVGENSQDFESANFSSGWVDFNSNGKLDLFVANQNRPNILFSQDANGTFTKVTSGELITYIGQTAGHSWADYDNDGDMDVFLIDNSLSTTPNRLYKNNGDGTFTRVTGLVFDTELDLSGFTTSWGDYDNDGDLDLFMGTQDNGPANSLYRNNGAAQSYSFTKVLTTPVSEAKSNSTFGSAWGDIDNDGDIDLLTGNDTDNVIYQNNGTGSFTKIVTEKFNDVTVANFGISMGDYNKDGFVDVAAGTIDPSLFQEGGFLLVSTVNSQLYKNNNTTSASRNWIEIKLKGTLSNASAIGTRLTLTAGGKTQIREINTPTGFSTGGSLIAHFGLGSSTTITTLQVKWPSGTINTFSNIPVSQINQVMTITEDGTGPVVTNYVPAFGNTSVTALPAISIDLNEASTPVANKKLNVYLQSNLGAPVFSINVTTATKVGNQYQFTLPSKLQPNSDYTITIDAGAFEDIFGNDSPGLVAGTWTFKTTVATAISALSPAHNATNVAATSALEITFTKNITAVATKKIKVMDGTTAIVDLDVITNGTVAANKYTLPAPAAKWPYNKTLQVVVDAGAFIDTDQHDFAGITSGNWSFTTSDNVPPVITYTLPANVTKGTGTTFTAGITDNVSISEAILHYRKISGKDYATIVGIVNGTDATKYDFAVQSSFFDEMGIEYYFTAKDPAANEARSPDGEGTYKTNVVYTGVDTRIPSERLGFGGQKANWKVFSIPFDLGTNNSVTTIFDELASNSSLKNKIDYRLIAYNNSPAKWNEYPGDFSTIDRGTGYFINIKNPIDIVIGSNLAAPTNSRSNLFQIQLKQGWNMVGNPYLTPISWSDVATFNNLTGTAADLKKFSAGQYSSNATLQPFEGGFVFVSSNVTISIPFAGQTTPGGRKRLEDLGTDINADQWGLNLKLTQGEFNYNLSSVGMASDASTGFDDYDDVTPPRFFDYLEVNFSHPEYFASRFTRDVVPTSSEFAWEFTVDSNVPGEATLAWDDLSSSAGSKELFLLDVERQKLVNMKTLSNYSFLPGHSSRFKIYFGENLTIAPDKVQLGKAYPNPTSGYTTFTFSLPETGGLQQDVTLDVLDALGRPVTTLSQGRYNPGYHEISWLANNVTNGLYTYRLTVLSKAGRTIQLEKLIIK